MNLSDEQSKQRLKEILLSVSLANLFFLSKWAEYFHTPNDYFRKMPYNWVNYVGILLNIFIFSLLFWAGRRLIVRSKSGALRVIARVAFLAVLLVPLNLLRAKLDLRLTKLMPYAPLLLVVGLAGL